jgi:hypothetical protein
VGQPVQVRFLSSLLNRHSTNEADSGSQAEQEAIPAMLAEPLSTLRVEPVAQSVEQRTFKRNNKWHAYAANAVVFSDETQFSRASERL